MPAYGVGYTAKLVLDKMKNHKQLLYDDIQPNRLFLNFKKELVSGVELNSLFFQSCGL